jgi:hypothetical protein
MQPPKTHIFVFFNTHAHHHHQHPPFPPPPLPPTSGHTPHLGIETGQVDIQWDPHKLAHIPQGHLDSHMHPPPTHTPPPPPSLPPYPRPHTPSPWN